MTLNKHIWKEKKTKETSVISSTWKKSSRDEKQVSHLKEKPLHYVHKYTVCFRIYNASTYLVRRNVTSDWSIQLEVTAYGFDKTSW